MRRLWFSTGDETWVWTSGQEDLRVLTDRELSVILEGQYGADCQQRVQAPLASWYTTAAAALWEATATLTRAAGAPPSVAVVHSPQSLPRLLSRGTESVLVYDQHLGQVFARLTKLTLGRASPVLVDSYLSNLAGVRLLSRGRWQHAAVLAAMSTSFRDQAVETSPTESESERSRRHRLTSAQEMFVLGHELAHHLRFVDPEAFASFGDDVETVLTSWQNGPTSDLDAEYMVDELTRSAVAVWERRKGTLGEGEVEQIRRSFAEQTDPRAPEGDRRTTFDTFMNDAHFREEATCDVLAGLTAIPVLMRGGLPAKEAVEAVGYALHHLRLMQTVNLVADGHGPAELTRGLRTSMHRLTTLRTALGYLLDVIYQRGVVSQEQCHEIMTGVNMLHSEIIGDQMLWQTSFTLREALHLPRGTETPAEVVRGALGFGASGRP